MTKQDELFCVGQKAVIHKDGQILVLHDPLPIPGCLDLPGGKIQESERDFKLALQREVREETNLEIKVGAPFFTSYWEFPAESTHRNKGKKIFLVFYRCEYVSGEVIISDEHDAYKWITKENYKDELKEKNNMYHALTQYFLLNI